MGMQRVERLEIMDVCTTKPHSPWKNKDKSVIKIIKVNPIKEKSIKI